MIIDTDNVTLDELAALTVRKMSWPAFKAEILPSLRRPMVSRKHEAKVEQVIRELEALGIATTADLNLSLIARYIASRPPGQSAWTLKSHLQILATLCNLAVRYRCLIVSPFSVKPVCKLVRTGPPQGKRAYSLEEIRRLFEVLRSDVATKKGWPAWRARRLEAIAAVAFYAGLRKTELLTLHVADLDFDAHVIRLVPRGKGFKTDSSAQPVGMPLALEPTLRSWLEWRMAAPADLTLPPAEECPFLFPCVRKRNRPWLHGPAGGKALDELAKVGLRANIPDLTFHGCRRSLATAMEAFGLGAAMIQRTMRHSRPQTTELHYRKADETNIAAAVRDIRF